MSIKPLLLKNVRILKKVHLSFIVKITLFPFILENDWKLEANSQRKALNSLLKVFYFVTDEPIGSIMY
jgi:hypothetical protein